MAGSSMPYEIQIIKLVRFHKSILQKSNWSHAHPFSDLCCVALGVTDPLSSAFRLGYLLLQKWSCRVVHQWMSCIADRQLALKAALPPDTDRSLFYQFRSRKFRSTRITHACCVIYKINSNLCASTELNIYSSRVRLATNSNRDANK